MGPTDLLPAIARVLPAPRILTAPAGLAAFESDGLTTFRAPYTPVTFGAIVNHGRGKRGIAHARAIFRSLRLREIPLPGLAGRTERTSRRPFEIVVGKQRIDLLRRHRADSRGA